MVSFVLAASSAQANCTLASGNLAATPDSRFVDNGNGTVTDRKTRLTWDKNLLAAGAVAWSSAVSSALGNTTGGFNDWRLPSRNELLSIVETGCVASGRAINSTFFSTSGPSTVWSSTDVGSSAWAVSFQTGYDRPESKQAALGVRTVRGGLDIIFFYGFE
ncbi:MAG: DUF1566 domain-containing protein [Rhodanobacteraceae bacterium]|nr:DUF1566 domain-containing protein [Rhodanobacteraceae bacterium]